MGKSASLCQRTHANMRRGLQRQDAAAWVHRDSSECEALEAGCRIDLRVGRCSEHTYDLCPRWQVNKPQRVTMCHIWGVARLNSQRSLSECTRESVLSALIARLGFARGLRALQSRSSGQSRPFSQELLHEGPEPSLCSWGKEACSDCGALAGIIKRTTGGKNSDFKETVVMRSLFQS